MLFTPTPCDLKFGQFHQDWYEIERVKLIGDYYQAQFAKSYLHSLWAQVWETAKVEPVRLWSYQGQPHQQMDTGHSIDQQNIRKSKAMYSSRDLKKNYTTGS